MSFPLKIVIPVIGIGGMGATGGYFLFSDFSTAKDKLKEELKGLPRKILDSDYHAEWSDWVKVYEASSLKIEGVPDSESLIKWCTDSLGQKFDKSKYDSVKLWCVINTSSLEREAASKGVNLISGTGSDVEGKFKEAWKKVNSGKQTAGDLSIGDDKVTGTSIRDENVGGPALKTWCTTRYSWVMYKLESRNDLDKVMKWCNESSGRA